LKEVGTKEKAPRPTSTHYKVFLKEEGGQSQAAPVLLLLNLKKAQVRF
jgi:hypothetical protein